MTTIFLDIDGVLTTHIEMMQSQMKFWLKNPDAKEMRIPYHFSKKCVKILNEILQETECQIVLSSDWRHYWTLEELDKIFKWNKVIQSPVDVTGNYPISFSDITKNRANEIDLYIEEHNLTDFVILDDLPLSGYLKNNNFIICKDTEGLKQTNHKNKILNLIKKTIK
jgi:hypothetical protein